MTLTRDYKCNHCEKKVDVLYFDIEDKKWRCKKCTRYLEKEEYPISHRLTRPRGIFATNKGI